MKLALYFFLGFSGFLGGVAWAQSDEGMSKPKDPLPKESIPPQGKQKEIFAGKPVDIETIYVNIANQEKRIYKVPIQKSWDFNDLRGVAEASVDNGLVTFVGTKEGAGLVLYLDKNPYTEVPQIGVRYVVFVSASEFSQSLAALRELIGDVEGLEIKIVGNRIVVDGEILIPSEFRRVLRVLESGPYKDQVDFYATYSPLALQMIARRISEEIKDVNVTVRVLNNRILLEGNVDSPAVVERYLSIAKGFLPEDVSLSGQGRGASVNTAKFGPDYPRIESLLVVASENAPDAKKMIQITIHYVELTGDYNNTFQFNWAPTINPKATINYNKNIPDQNDGFSTTFTALIDSLFPKLTSSRSHNHARILKTATLVVQDQEESNLVTSINVPYTTVNRSPNTGDTITQNLEEIRNTARVSVNILPGRDQAQRQMLNVGVNLDFRDQTSPGSVGARPATSSNSVQTTLSVANGQSIAIGGLLNDGQRAGYKAGEPPAQGQAIFNLGRGKNYSHNNSKFVVFLTPQIINDPEAEADELKRKFKLRRGLTGE